jgi:hypothetical protein
MEVGVTKEPHVGTTERGCTGWVFQIEEGVRQGYLQITISYLKTSPAAVLSFLTTFCCLKSQIRVFRNRIPIPSGLPPFIHHLPLFLHCSHPPAWVFLMKGLANLVILVGRQRPLLDDLDVLKNVLGVVRPHDA